MANDTQQQIVGTLEGFFAKAPALPTNIREVLVKIAPILALIFGILGIIVGLGVLGISPVVLFAGAETTTLVLIGIVVTMLSSAMLLFAYPGLKSRKMSGWMLLFWSEVVSVIGSLLSGSILGAVIGALIGFYLIFQIKSYYK